MQTFERALLTAGLALHGGNVYVFPGRHGVEVVKL
jgi:hypothetical protein